MTYRVRCELQGTAASVLRRLHVASDVFLDDLHEVLQVAFGWTDSHLHRFASGPSYYSKRAEYYLMPFEVDEG
ncbi:MAG: IS1096 element passenger TnpR family protein, partial [Pseudonocardiaceae bacterium]